MHAVALDLDRAAEKQMSRDRDQARLQAGTISPSALARENDFFRDIPIERFRIVSLGRKPVARR